MSEIVLIKHEGKRFDSQTVYVSGHAYIGCVFENCTMVVTNVAGILSHCTFNYCNFHLDYMLLSGDPAARKFLRSLLDLMEGGGGEIRYSPN